MSCKNQEKSRSQPFLSRHASLVSSSLPDETKPDAFFLQTVPDSIIFEIPQTYLNIQREKTEMKTQFEIEKYVLRKKYYRWLLAPRLLFLSCYFSSASKTVKYGYFGRLTLYSWTGSFGGQTITSVGLGPSLCTELSG